MILIKIYFFIATAYVRTEDTDVIESEDNQVDADIEDDLDAVLVGEEEETRPPPEKPMINIPLPGVFQQVSVAAGSPIAEAKPIATATAEDFGLAQAAPAAIAQVGPGGVAISLPQTQATVGHHGIAVSRPMSKGEAGFGGVAIAGGQSIAIAAIPEKVPAEGEDVPIIEIEKV